MVLTCTPRNIIELVVGRLFTEGHVDGIDEIASISLCEFSEHVSVTLVDADAKIRTYQAEEVATCCTGTKTVASVGSRRKPMKPLPQVAIDPEQIFTMADAFAYDTPLHANTFGVHSCALYEGREERYCFEDLGRHNALDKAVGAALMDGVDMGKLAAYSSGRVPEDMIAKAIRSRIPLFVTKATPTARSVEIAKRYGLTLVGKARPDSFAVFNGTLERGETCPDETGRHILSACE